MFEGAKILVVEDNYLLAEVVCDFVADCGMKPIGPACGLEQAMVYARQAPLDGAILDIDLAGWLSFPVCSVLRQRGIPFCFLTGYSDLSLVPQQFRAMPLVSKPFEDEEMRGAIDAMLSGKLGSPLMRAASTTAKTSTLSKS
jgi:DNA-binding response OmpR family regulator